jgi:cellulose synthase/poly-beta-1,6-N-acetylglucosamine synthase-like glycosyltransferase
LPPITSTTTPAQRAGCPSAGYAAAVAATTLLTLVGLYFILGEVAGLMRVAFGTERYALLPQVAVVYTIVLVLIFGIVMHCLADFGFYLRRTRRATLPRVEIEEVHGEQDRQDLLVLVPSYKEEANVVRQTLISAALVEYPGRRVVLLIDDPPAPATDADAASLDAARRLPGEVQLLLDGPAARLGRELAAYEERERLGGVEPAAETVRLTELYRWAAGWLEAQAAGFADGGAGLSHTDRLFVDRVLLEPARAHRAWAAELRRSTPGGVRIEREYRRLAALFRVELASFERKRYANLSHAPNKAMNLNSYLALVGGSFREVARPDGLHLEARGGDEASLRVPDAPYVASLDADSLMTWDYALRLVPVMERPGGERIAIAQTPYTAVPNPPALIERAASSSTDAQFFNHQGMAHFGASFWVGASALMRRAALDDIAIVREERGHTVRVYIDDRILIEDAAATADLLQKGWRVHHDGGRLSYSATPADFGALLIQRRRWANGGLLILPRLLRHTFRRPWSARKLVELVLRLPNLIAGGVAGLGLPILLVYRFDDSLVPLWMPLVALPYYLLYGVDMRLAGYRWADLPRVYALNTLLIVVNLGGTLNSLRQAWTGRPVPFQRTPKIAGRTRTPPSYLAAIYGLCGYALASAALDGMAGRWTHMLFGFVNGTAAAYGIVVFIGLAESRDDMRAQLTAARRRWLGPARQLGRQAPAA